MKVAFLVPFITDSMSSAIRECLRKADLQDTVRVVEIPPKNLKTQLVRNRLYDRICTTSCCTICPSGKAGDCMISGTVYLIKCLACKQEYVGETSRPLCVRVKEHLVGFRKSNPSTPLGDHRVRTHAGGGFNIEVSILARESDISARRTLEALWIAARLPKMNRKEECVTVTQELAAFADMCGFDMNDKSEAPKTTVTRA